MTSVMREQQKLAFREAMRKLERRSKPANAWTGVPTPT